MKLTQIILTQSKTVSGQNDSNQTKPDSGQTVRYDIIDQEDTYLDQTGLDRIDLELI